MTGKPSSFKRLESADLWVRVAIAADMLGVSTNTILYYVDEGMVRAKKEASEHNPSGYRYVVCREDLKEIYTYRKNGTPLLRLWDRGVAPLSCEGMSGAEITAWAEATGHEGVLLGNVPESLQAIKEQVSTLFIPDEDNGPDETEDILSDALLRIKNLEDVVKSLAASFGSRSARADILSDREIELLLERLAKIPTTPLPLRDIDKWISTFKKLSSEHVGQLSNWSERYPDRSRALLPDGLPAYAMLIRLSHRIYDWMSRYPGSDLKGTVLFSMKIDAEREWHRLRELCLAQATVDNILALNQSSAIPVGHCATDQYLLKKLLARK